MANYLIAHFDEIDAVECPCGLSKRAFVSPENPTATMHVVDIQQDATVHYHKKLTEIYFVLEGSGEMELDGERVPIKPFTAIFIKPGCRHRAVGKMRIVNVCIPPFDTEDEWFD
ncbi:MAG: cupin domain-containing protein [Phycisphaerales bacterium]|jgi:mannose-6-phosphate isomerase-like protein (cupin superfamily)